MPHIAIISSSVRTGRESSKVAAYFYNYISEHKLGSVEIIDLKAYDFPIFHERLHYLENPPENLLQYAEKITNADGVIIVTPEYNGGYPASLKNAIDVLYKEWHRKPIAIATVSNGDFGGTQVITSLVFSLWKIRACLVTARFPVQNVIESFDENGVPADKETTDKRAQHFLEELLWNITAQEKMKEK